MPRSRREVSKSSKKRQFFVFLWSIYSLVSDILTGFEYIDGITCTAVNKKYNPHREYGIALIVVSIVGFIFGSINRIGEFTGLSREKSMTRGDNEDTDCDIYEQCLYARIIFCDTASLWIVLVIVEDMGTLDFYSTLVLIGAIGSFLFEMTKSGLIALCCCCCVICVPIIMGTINLIEHSQDYRTYLRVYTYENATHEKIVDWVDICHPSCGSGYIYPRNRLSCHYEDFQWDYCRDDGTTCSEYQNISFQDSSFCAASPCDICFFECSY